MARSCRNPLPAVLRCAAVLILAAALAGCALAPGPTAPPAEGPWRHPGSQTDLSPAIRRAAAGLPEDGGEATLTAALDFVLTHHRYDPYLATELARRRASEMLASGVLGGCADYAVVTTALLRARGVPARMILTVESEWVRARRDHPLRLPRGHVFVEVHIDGGWRLLDVPYRTLYWEHAPEDPVLPRGERYCLRTNDFWDDGLVGPERVLARMVECAAAAGDRPLPAVPDPAARHL